MVPSASPAKYLSRAGSTRVGRAHQRQRVLAHPACNRDVGDRTRGVASIWIIGTTGVDLTIEDPGGARGILVAHLCVEHGC